MLHINGVEVGYSWVTPIVLVMAYDMASRAALQNWIAVSALEAPVPESTDGQAAKRRRFVPRPAGLAFLALLVVEVWIVLKGDEQTVQYFFAALVGCILTSSFYATLSHIVGMPTVAYKTVKGRVVYRPLHNNWQARASRIALVLGCACLSYTVVSNTLDSMALRLLSTASLIFSITSRCTSRRVSLRRMTIFFCVYEAVVLAAMVGLVFAYHYRLSSSSDSTVGSTLWQSFMSLVKQEREELQAASKIASRTSLINAAIPLIPALYAVPVGHYIATLLRFDWHQARTSLSSTNVVVLEQVAARTGCNGQRQLTGPGLIIPSSTSLSSIIASSQRTYYETGMLIVTFVYMAAAPLLHYMLSVYVFGTKASSSAFDYNPLEQQIFAAVATFIIMPLLAIAVSIKSSVRGEKKALWTYEEVWCSKKSIKSAAASVDTKSAAYIDVEHSAVADISVKTEKAILAERDEQVPLLSTA